MRRGILLINHTAAQCMLACLISRTMKQCATVPSSSTRKAADADLYLYTYVKGDRYVCMYTWCCLADSTWMDNVSSLDSCTWKSRYTSFVLVSCAHVRKGLRCIEPPDIS